MRRFDLPTVRALVDRFAKLQGLAQRGWRFAVSLVPGLTHTGEDGTARDAWATVATDIKAKVAEVKVRDLAATPLPAEDPWHELEVTISHELWHPWITKLLAEPTVENEEDFAEAAAQAMCARGADARVMARSIEAIPAAVRARVAKTSARTVRARGGSMDPELVKQALDALESGDAAKAMELLKGLIAAAASGGAAPHVEPDGDEIAPPAREDNGGGMDPKDNPGGPPAARPMARDDKQPEDDNARRARLRREDDAITAFRREAAKDELITHVRARLAGHAGLSAVERRITAAPDFLTAKQIADIAIEMGGAGPARARGADTRPAGTPPPPSDAKPKYEEAKLIAEGINPILAKQIAAETDPKVADMTLGAARARIASNGSPWPTAKNGGAS